MITEYEKSLVLFGGLITCFFSPHVIKMKKRSRFLRWPPLLVRMLYPEQMLK